MSNEDIRRELKPYVTEAQKAMKKHPSESLEKYVKPYFGKNPKPVHYNPHDFMMMGLAGELDFKEVSLIDEEYELRTIRIPIKIIAARNVLLKRHGKEYLSELEKKGLEFDGNEYWGKKH